MIPKKIHYIWFGGKLKPPLILEMLETWKKFLPSYEIHEWNESNFDVTQHPWMKAMYESGKFAFASDWARLHLLHEHGGIYLDTDVEIKKPLDGFLHHDMFWGFEYDCYLATCITGSKPGHPFLRELLTEYDRNQENLVNNAIVTRYFLKRFPEFRLTNHTQQVGDGIQIYGKEYFSIPSFNSKKGFARHHGSNLWKGGKSPTSPLKTAVRSLLGETLYYKLIAHKVCVTNEFYPIYRKHLAMAKTKPNPRQPLP